MRQLGPNGRSVEKSGFGLFDYAPGDPVVAHVVKRLVDASNGQRKSRPRKTADVTLPVFSFTGKPIDMDPEAV